MEAKSSIIAIGLTVHNTPVEIREKLSVPEVRCAGPVKCVWCVWSYTGRPLLILFAFSACTRVAAGRRMSADVYCALTRVPGGVATRYRGAGVLSAHRGGGGVEHVQPHGALRCGAFVAQGAHVRHCYRVCLDASERRACI